MKKFFTIVLLFSNSLIHAQDLVINNARIIDGTGQVIEQGSVVVNDGKIVSVSQNRSSGGSRQINAQGMTLMPGFIDAHRHIIEGNPDNWMQEQASSQMQAYLDAGFTTVLSAGDSVSHIIELRQKVNDGGIVGPRLIVSGIVPLAKAGGFPRGVDPARLSVTGRLPQPTEPPDAVPATQLRDMVRAHADTGVDAIKTIFMGMPGDIEEQALAVIADEAEKQGIISITHAVSVADMNAAVRAGTHVLVHTPTRDQVDETSAHLAAESGIPMVSTLGVFVPTFAEDNTRIRAKTGHDVVPRFRDLDPFPEGAEGILNGGMGPVNARLLWDAGVKIGYGTDTRFVPADSLKHELKALSLFFPRSDIITMMTRNAAASVMRSDEIGTLEAGKMADMVLINGDPLTDIEELLHISVVIKNGEVVVDKR